MKTPEMLPTASSSMGLSTNWERFLHALDICSVLILRQGCSSWEQMDMAGTYSPDFLMEVRFSLPRGCWQRWLSLGSGCYWARPQDFFGGWLTLQSCVSASYSLRALAISAICSSRLLASKHQSSQAFLFAYLRSSASVVGLVRARLIRGVVLSGKERALRAGGAKFREVPPSIWCGGISCADIQHHFDAKPFS